MAPVAVTVLFISGSCVHTTAMVDDKAVTQVFFCVNFNFTQTLIPHVVITHSRRENNLVLVSATLTRISGEARY